MLIGFTLKIDELFIYMYTCLPFFNILNYKMGTTSMFYILVITFIFKYYTDKSIEHFKIKSKMMIICLIILFVIYNINALGTYIKWLIMILPLILTYKEQKFYTNLVKVIFYYSLSTILASIMGYIMMNNGSYIYLSSYVWNSGEVYTRFSGLIGDSLVYSQILAILISLNLIKIEKLRKIKLVDVAFIGVLITCGILTYSKTFIILMVLIFLYYFFYKLYRNIKEKKSINFMMFCAICVVGIVVLLQFISTNSDSEIVSSYITRFTSSDLLTGRTTVYKHFFELWKENPQVILLGIGFAKYVLPYQLESGTTVIYAHNIFIESISLFGFLVCIVLLIIGLNAIYKFFKCKKDIIYLLPTFILFASGMVLHGNLEFSYYFNLILVIIVFCNGVSKNKEENKEK